MPFSLIQARGRSDITAKLHLIQLPFHLTIVYVFTLKWGVVGAAIAWSMRNLVDALLLFTAGKRIFRIRFIGFYKSGVINAALLLAGLLVVGLGLESYLERILHKAILGGVFATIAPVFAWRFCLDQADRNTLINLCMSWKIKRHLDVQRPLQKQD